MARPYVHYATVNGPLGDEGSFSSCQRQTETGALHINFSVVTPRGTNWSICTPFSEPTYPTTDLSFSGQQS